MKPPIAPQPPLSDALTSFFAKPAPQDEVLAPGEPPLTRAMVNRVAGWIEWILDVRLPAEVRKMVEDGCIADWREGKKVEIAGHLQVLQFQEALERQNQETRDALREEHQSAVVAAFRAQASEPTAAALLILYDLANAPIAPGSPPLTNEMASCYLDMLCFVFTMEWLPLPEPLRSQQLQLLVEQYPTLPPTHQAWFAQLPRQWTALRAAWRNSPQPVSKEALRGHIFMNDPILQDMVRRTDQILVNRGPMPIGPPALVGDSGQPVRAASRGGSTDDLLQDISSLQNEEEKKLAEEAAALEAAGDAEGARAVRAELTMRKLQSSAQNAQLLSNISRMRSESMMAIARNMR